MRRFRTLTCLAGVALAVAGNAQAPETATSFGETIDVRIVSLDVVVVDSDGHRVTGLGPEDFAIQEDGEPVEITHFSEVRSGSLALVPELEEGGSAVRSAAPSTENAETPPLRLAMLVDGAHTSPTSRRRFLEEVWPELRDGLRPEDRVLVAHYDGSLRVVTPFTTDREAVGRGFEEIASKPGIAMQIEQEERTAIEQIRQRQRSAVNAYQRTLSGGGSPEMPCPADLGVFARSYAASAHSRAIGSLSALQNLADSLAGFDGRTAIAHVTDGLPLVPGAPVYDFAISLCDGSGARAGLADSFDVYSVNVDKRSQLFDPNAARMEMQELNLADDIRRVAGHANAHSVPVYTFDAGGLRAAGTGVGAGMSRAQTEQASFSHRRDLQDSLIQLADATGGRALVDSNRFDESLAEMLEDLGSYYSLGYRPAVAGATGVHDLKITVKGRGLRILAPETRRSKSAGEEIVDRMISVIYHRDASNALGIAADARPDPEGGRTLVRVAVPMSRLTLVPKEGHHEGAVTVFLSGGTGESPEGPPVRQRTMIVRVPSDRLTQALTESYTFGAALPGDLTGEVLAVGVRDDPSGRLSFVSTEVGPGASP